MNRIRLFLLFILSNTTTDFIITLRRNFFPVFVFYFDTVFICLGIPVWNCKRLIIFTLPLCLSNLIPIFIIQCHSIIAFFWHFHLNLYCKLILQRAVIWYGKIIKINISCITQASFQAACFIPHQKAEI